jgi:hypothetical protein
LVAVPDMNRRKALAVLSMLPLAGSLAGIAGAATPDLRLAKLAWIGERLAGSSEGDIRHWLDPWGAARPSRRCCGMSGRRLRATSARGGWCPLAGCAWRGPRLRWRRPATPM